MSLFDRVRSGLGDTPTPESEVGIPPGVDEDPGAAVNPSATPGDAVQLKFQDDEPQSDSPSRLAEHIGEDPTLVQFDASPGTLDVTDHPLHFAYGHGQRHGKWRVGTEPYERYLELKAAEEGLLAEVDGCRASTGVDREARREAAALRGRLAAKEVEVEHAKSRESSLESEAKAASAAVESARERLVGYKGIGSRVYVLLFGLAGSLFVAGDVALARFTVAKGFKMPPVEGWIFAAGLAALAFVLKPAYDRLVEDRYHEGRKLPFGITIVATAILVGVFLLMLGGYRADYLRLDDERDSMEEEVDRLDGSIASKTSLEGQELQVASLTAERDTANARMLRADTAIRDNALGRWSMILAQLLFAVAGAICFGITTRNLRDYVHVKRPLKSRLGMTLWRSNKYGPTLLQAASSSEQVHEAASAHVLALEQEGAEIAAVVAAIESEADALDRIDGYRTREREAVKELASVRADLYKHLYRTGHAMGEKLPEPEVQYGSGDGQSGAVPSLLGPDSSSAKRGPGRHRPYLAVREAVRRAVLSPDSEDS